jgi:hypothetical protein
MDTKDHRAFFTTLIFYVGCYVLTVMSRKITLFWDVMQCSAVEVLHDACFLLGLIFDPEDGGSIVLGNADELLPSK